MSEIVMETEYMLTTLDNPYDYFDQFIPWLMYDKSCHYNSCEYLDRIIQKNGGLSDDMTQKEINLKIKEAIDEIIEFNPLGIYKLISREVPVEEVEDV